MPRRHRLGLYSVLVGRTGVACPSDQQIRHIHDLPAALPWLWRGQQPPPAPPAVPEAAAAAEATAPPLKAGKVGAKSSEEESEGIEAVYAVA